MTQKSGNNLTLYPKELEKEEQIKPKISRRKKITTIKAEIMKWRPNTKDQSNYELVIFLVCFYFEVKAPYYVQGSLAKLWPHE